jgi:hypothetical protein
LQELQKTGTATGSNWICSCSCPAWAHFSNLLQLVATQHVIREDFGDENKSKITQNGQEMGKL